MIWENNPVYGPESMYGFIYRITFLLDGRQYIGKKSYHVYKKSKKVKESNWKEYTSSSTELNELIKEYGKECFYFEILVECPSKGSWSYMESNIMHKWNVLTEVDHHTGMRRYINKMIDAVRWIPRDCDIPLATLKRIEDGQG